MMNQVKRARTSVTMQVLDLKEWKKVIGMSQSEKIGRIQAKRIRRMKTKEMEMGYGNRREENKKEKKRKQKQR